MSIAEVFGRPVAFYGVRPGQHETVTCGDCGFPADVLFGDHGGQCLDQAFVVLPHTPLGIIRAYAHEHPGVVFSANDLRARFDRDGIPGPSRGPAFDTARRRGYIERVGYEPSDPTSGANGHEIKQWRSLTVTPAMAAARRGAA